MLYIDYLWCQNSLGNISKQKSEFKTSIHLRKAEIKLILDEIQHTTTNKENKGGFSR